MKKYLVFLLAALAYSAGIKAQGVTGKVMESDTVSVPYAAVSLLQASDSTYITGAMSDEEGAFSFNTTPTGKLLRISSVGYKTLILPATDSMVVTLQPSEQSLEGVTVTAVRPAFKMERGLFVSNIQGTVFSKLGKVTDVLQQIPMMSMDGLSVLGRGTPLVYINNKLMRSRSELERISSDMIKDIKIDLNPGAKYGSTVRAVLFINTIKPVGEGLGGSLTLTESVSSCWNTNGWLNLNYRKNNLDLFVSSSFNTFSNSHYKRQDVYDFLYKGETFNADYSGDGYNSSKSGFVSVGFNKQFTDRQSLGATYSFSRLFSGNSDQTYRNHVRQGDAFTEFDTHSHQFSQSGNHNVSVYYENKFNDKFALNVDGTYAHNNSNGRQTIVDKQADNSSTLIPVTESRSDLAAQKTVFTSSVGNAKLEYGFETSYTRFLQKYHVDNKDYSGVLQTNDNESKQSAASLFVNYNQSFGKLYTQLGLRYEYANYDYYASGKLLDESSRTYHRVLPSASLSYMLNRLSLMLSYNIYTSSPSYSQLDDGLQYISDFRYNKGNSLLKPTYNHAVSFNASYRNLHLMCNYAYERDAIVTWFDVMEQIPAVLSSSVNHSYSSMYVGLSYAPTLFKIWRPSWHLWGNKQWLSYNGVGYGRPQFGLQWKNLLVLPKSWFIILNASGNLKGNANTYMAQSSVRVDMAVQKNMKNLWVKLGASNLFNAKEKGYSQYTGIYTSHWVDYRQPVVSLTISYSFNPAKSKYKGNGAGQSELNRL